MADTSDERALATQLAELGPGRLARLLYARGVSASVSWKDCFDAAEGLLDAASIDRALTRLDRAAVQTLDAAADASVAEEARAPLDAFALLRPDGRPYGIVTARLRELLPDAMAVQPAAADPAVADARAAATVAERAAAAVRTLTDIVALNRDQPLTVTGAGAITAVDRRRLIDAHIVPTATELDDLLALAADAGLLVLVGREWLVTDAGDAWLPGDLVTRWAHVATAWRDTLPAALRTDDGGYHAPETWAAQVPLDTDWPNRAEHLLRRAERWGLYDRGGAEPGWTTPLRAGGFPETAVLAPLVPGEIDKIYLQADLSAIAPGPLRSGLDLRLRTMAVRESVAQASTYRFSADSLAAAIAGGEDAASIRVFLSELSLTGIPQPLEYLIDQAEARHGLIRVGMDAAGRTRVTGAEPRLVQTLAVDQALRSIGLVPDGPDALTSRVSRDAVFWTLADARYPVIAVDENGMPQPLRRRRAPVAASTRPDPAAALLPVAEDLIAHSGGDADRAWLQRELDHAVRSRSEIVVTVRLPDGAERAFTIEASGLGGGRLRGRDRGADVERTLPVSSIVAVRPR
ncbi:helicase-associated domain-containing protein [Microbacterium horticulturae]|uniref:Helicase-associated domain-containing protein n=1 Tax=Microbacterium horticulturae TaxID=3028316 RepID=A0ABY8C3T9_9MICO|nr:helicase-associated domain-containing protein [Microbacterium sp. KACC 23027]WEG09870.1 helicase-associated domain-containing protein [Microbacterium sp. KACC 23027]